MVLLPCPAVIDTAPPATLSADVSPAESDDPERMVPITFEADDFMVAVSGDPLRTNAITFAHNGILGYTVAREIDLPTDWEAKLKSVR